METDLIEVTAVPVFHEWDKIPRLTRDMVVTEKLDGTHGLVRVLEDGRVLAGSRSRWLTLEEDNFGFAHWVKAHEDELRFLGAGAHYGEWWGQGIQRRYDLTEKRFSLFNTRRWGDAEDRDHVKYPLDRPACCHVVPTIATGRFNTATVDAMLMYLMDFGSLAAPGFMKPEGVVVFHTAANIMFKKTLDNDGHKGQGK